jgi:hypothetical protein
MPEIQVIGVNYRAPGSFFQTACFMEGRPYA